MIKRKIITCNIIDYINIFLWIMLSGSVVMLQHGGVYIPLVLIFYLIQMVLRRKSSVSIYNTIVFLFLEVAYFLNYLIYSEQCWGPQQYFVNILLVFCAFTFAELFSENNFKNKYVDIMAALALYSLVMHYGGMTFGWNNFAVRDGNIMPVALHNYWAFSVGRNSGIFWEPGGYQIFLNLALIFSTLDHTRNVTKQEWWKRIILVVTILTTKSTAGFVLTAVICVFILRTMLSNVQMRTTRVFAWILYCMAVVGITIWKAIATLTDRTIATAKGLPFTITFKGNELFVSRKEKSITRATVDMAYQQVLKLQEAGEAIDGPKKLGTFGASYLYPLFIALGVIEAALPPANKNNTTAEMSDITLSGTCTSPISDYNKDKKIRQGEMRMPRGVKGSGKKALAADNTVSEPAIARVCF